MKESTAYQAYQEVLEERSQQGEREGAIREARKLLLKIGSKQFGRPNPRILAALEEIADLERLEALIERLFPVPSWKALLAEVPADRS